VRARHNLEDRAWRGYDPRAAVPAAVAAVAASAALLAGRWAVDLISVLPDWLGVFAVYVTVLAVWPTVLGVAAYRTVVRTYRLTDRAVLVDWGPLARPEPPVWLAELAAVGSGASWLGRRLDFGWVELRGKTGRTLRLTGLRDPNGFAKTVRELVSSSPGPPPH
jgi:hypothetical protein